MLADKYTNEMQNAIDTRTACYLLPKKIHTCIKTIGQAAFIEICTNYSYEIFLCLDWKLL